MANIEILSDEEPRLSSNTHTPPPPPAPQTIAFALEGTPGEAVFHVPMFKHLKQAERRDNPSPAELCRRLGEICLVRWGDRDTIPPDDEIDAVDDQEMLRLFLGQIENAEIGDYEVLDDRSHRVKLSCGSITFRRLTRKDIRIVENSKAGRVATEVMLAVSVTKEWWRGDRAIMPADFDPLSLEEWGRVSKALQGFLTGRASS